MTIPRLMLVTDRRRAGLPIVEVVRLAVTGGVDAVLIREKDLSQDELAALTREILDVVGDSERVLINGAPGIASELGTGLHLPEDAKLSDVERSRLAEGALVGRSVHDVASARGSVGFDYVIAGHVFETGSKAGLPVLGLNGLSAIVAAAPCPVLAIGGILPGTVSNVLASGAYGVAVMSGICASLDPERKTREYRDALNGGDMSQQSDPGSGAIVVQVNGKAAELESEMTIAEFLIKKGLHQNMVVVEHNGKILKKAQFGESEIRAGDVLEVVHFVGGG
jgi:thiamine biosynthesis protein ThiS